MESKKIYDEINELKLVAQQNILCYVLTYSVVERKPPKCNFDIYSFIRRRRCRPFSLL